MWEMTESELSEVISKYQMPEGRYLVEQEGSFGESEFFWVIQNQLTNQKYLLMNTYSHHGVEAEVKFYRECGFDNLRLSQEKLKLWKTQAMLIMRFSNIFLGYILFLK